MRKFRARRSICLAGTIEKLWKTTEFDSASRDEELNSPASIIEGDVSVAQARRGGDTYHWLTRGPKVFKESSVTQDSTGKSGRTPMCIDKIGF